MIWFMKNVKDLNDKLLKYKGLNRVIFLSLNMVISYILWNVNWSSLLSFSAVSVKCKCRDEIKIIITFKIEVILNVDTYLSI